MAETEGGAQAARRKNNPRDRSDFNIEGNYIPTAKVFILRLKQVSSNGVRIGIFPNLSQIRFAENAA
jgi:hypothetical protein